MSTRQLVSNVPQTVSAGDLEMREMQRLLREMEEANAERDAELHTVLEQLNPLQAQADEIQGRFQARIDALQEEYDERDTRMRAFAQSHRQELERLAGAKLFRFDCGGFVQWRFSPKRLKISAKAADIAAALRSRRRSDLFEVTYKLKKAEIKKNPAIVEQIEGLEIVQDEVLIVNPRG